MFTALIMSLPQIDILAHDAVGRGVLSWLQPRHADYCTRFEDLISRGAKPMYSGRGIGILEWNLIWVKEKDCGDRIDFLLQYNMIEADVKNAIKCAKLRGYDNIMNTLEEYLREQTVEKKRREIDSVGSGTPVESTRIDSTMDQTRGLNSAVLVRSNINELYN